MILMAKAMNDVLKVKLYDHLVHNNPDLLINLQQEFKVNNYLNERVAEVEPLVKQWRAVNIPSYIIEERCMEALTRELRPSKFNYIRSVLEEEFEADYYRLREDGTLTLEIINLITACTPVFEKLGFSEENEDDRYLRYAVTGEIKEYMENQG